MKDGTTKVRIRDRRTDEGRSLIFKEADDMGKLLDVCRVLAKKPLSGLSIDDYVKLLKDGTEKS